ncbi:MAG: 30S ribosomal protein S6 [Gemmatimonadaceae bacterium]
MHLPANVANFKGYHNFTIPPPDSNGGRTRPQGGSFHVPRNYEAVYIFDSTLEDAAIQDKLTRFHQLLSVEGDIAVDNWGRRQLAYPIGQRENGYYVIARYAADPVSLPEYERALRLDEGVVRYLISLHEHEVGAPPMTEADLAAGRARGGDDDDDED